MTMPLTPDLEARVVHTVRSLAEFQEQQRLTAEPRRRLEGELAAAGSNRTRWFLAGWCEVCEQPSDFLLDWQYSDGRTPNFRERLLCTRCQLNNRQRFTLSWLRRETLLRPRPVSLYLYEQVTPFYRCTRQTLTGLTVTGSEYLGPDKKSGEEIDHIRHEDALALSFASEAFDLIVSNDVLEHVPDFRPALQEAGRVLKARGKLVFTIPFYSDQTETRRRAVIENGCLRELLPACYHGNPVSEQGSLVFHDFGWDILDACRQAGFSDAYALVYYSLQHGYVGSGGQLMFVAEK